LILDRFFFIFDENAASWVNVNLTKGMVIRQAESQVAIEKTGTVTPQPQIMEVKDSVTGKVNELLTPGGVLEVWGNNIKIAGDNPDCGLWFVPGSGDPIKAQVIVQNKPSTLIVMIPMLAFGNYTLKLVTQFTGSNLLKNPKTSFYLKGLTVPD